MFYALCMWGYVCIGKDRLYAHFKIVRGTNVNNVKLVILQIEHHAHVLRPYIFFFKIDIIRFQKKVTILHQHNLVEENVRFWGLRLYCDITERKGQERRSNVHRGGSQKWPTFLMNWSKFTFTVEEVSTNIPFKGWPWGLCIVSKNPNI
jgi:hypothetical protein